MIPSERFGKIYRENARWVPIAAFLLGFLFDAWMLRRIDEPKVIVQQAVYLIVSAALIGVELMEAARELKPPRFLAKVWRYREGFLHFLLGTLLNSYTIFYFKSASAVTSFVFIALLVALLTLNEFKRFGKSQTRVHVALLSLCLISYLASLAPILLGFIGAIPFMSAVAVSTLLFAGYFKLLRRKLGASDARLKSHLLVPFTAIHAAFVVLYFAHAIPPVPLSVKYMGIYHDVKRSEGGYDLTYTRPRWKFWQHGDQTFAARPGDVIHCYAQIFSPARFKDELQVRWLYLDPHRGWLPSDAIPLSVLGGRDEGYRVVTQKSNFQPGLWRVAIETQDGREVGRIGFRVVPDPGAATGEARELFRDIR